MAYDHTAIHIFMEEKNWSKALICITDLLERFPQDHYLLCLKGNCEERMTFEKKLIETIEDKTGDEFIRILGDCFGEREGIVYFKQREKDKLIDALAGMIMDVTSERFKELETRVTKLEFNLGESHDKA